MDTNETVKSIHRLATLRDAPSQGLKLSIVLTPNAPENPSTKEAADNCSWCAQTYMGKGQWGNIAAFGPSVEAALTSLHANLLAAHIKADERRAETLKAAQSLAP